MPRYSAIWALCLLVLWAPPARAVILWSDLGATLAHDSGMGTDILGGAAKRDNTATDTLYFKFHVDPLSDVGTEEYLAAFELFEKGAERLAVGNSLKAWGYSAFNASETGASNKVTGDIDLHSARPEPSGLNAFFPYELPRRGDGRTIVFKVEYHAGRDDLVTVWLNPDLAAGATEAGQPENLTTKFRADASFDEIRLRHSGGGGGWTFSEMAIATSFSDLVAENGLGEDRNIPGGLGSLAPTTFRSSEETFGQYLKRLATLAPFTFHSWEREPGLPQSPIRALAKTRDGYLWVGSDDGLARFDGVRFVSFGLREGLGGGPVRTLLGDDHGALWIGGPGGLVWWRDGVSTTFTKHDGLPGDSVTALAEDGTGRLWIGTESGLAVMKDGVLASAAATGEFRGRPVTALFKDQHGAVWIGAKGAGVFEFQNGVMTPHKDSSIEGLLQDPHCLLVDQHDRLWIGAGDDFVLCRDHGQWLRYRIPHHLVRPFITALAEEPDGTVWAGSASEGLVHFKDGKLAAITAGNGLSDNLVDSLLVDHEGGLWVGTDGGLNRLRRKNLSAFGLNEGLGDGPAQGLAEISAGVLWVSQPASGLYRWERRNFSRLELTNPPFADFPINSLLIARDGTCWAAGAGGLGHFKEPQTDLGQAEFFLLPGDVATGVAEDREGGLWAGTRGGVVLRFRDRNWTPIPGFKPTRAITAIAQNTDKWMWIGTDGDGLFRFKPLTRPAYEKVGGLLSESIRTLHVDTHGTLWIGTAGGGLSRWRDGGMVTFTTRDGLPDNTISQILEDDAERLWLGSSRGIACVSKRELNDLAAKKISTIYPQTYGRADGMMSEECAGGFFPAGARTKSGLLWFATQKGVVVADPPTLAPAPSVVLEEVLLDGVSDPEFRAWDSTTIGGNHRPASPVAEKTLQVPRGRHRVELRYTGLSFNAPERIRFRYRLEGLDPDWVDAETRRSAPYNYVPPGNYTFRVIACNGDGVWNENGASLALVALPLFWQTSWFIGTTSVGLLIAVVAMARVVEKRRMRRHLKRLEEEHAIVRERTRIARDLHDDLGSSLTRISLLSDLARADKDHPGQVEIHADKISQSAAQTVRALEEIVWAVRPGSDSLQSLVEYIAHFANELFDGDGTRCRLDLPHNLPARPLPPEMRHNIFLVVKEALTNVLKHAGAREVRVRATTSGNALEIVVEDDGGGFNPAAARSLGKRDGLGNMRRRAEAMGGTLALESAPGKGSVVRLVVKFPVWNGVG